MRQQDHIGPRRTGVARAAAPLVVAVALAIGGCSGTGVAPARTTAASDTSTANSSHVPATGGAAPGTAGTTRSTAMPTVVQSENFPGTVLVSLQNRTGPAEEDTQVSDEALFLHIDCSGPGSITVTATHIGSATLACGRDGSSGPLLVELDTTTRKGSTTIHVDAEPGQRWAVTATQGPHSTRASATPGS